MLLRAAAATAAWILVPILPVCGYVISLWLYTPSRSSTSKETDKQQMIYTSRAALPSEWDKRQWGRQQAAQQYLKVDGLTVKYIGPGETDAQAASIFADHPVPLDLPIYYFEVTIVSKGEHGYIGIGFCADDINLGRLPGWEPHSYGYHGDDGHAFHGSGSGRAFGPEFTTGDVIGALLDRSQRTISYYKNGDSVGTAFYDVKETHLYPCVGMRTANEEVRANFGAAPFAVDLSALQQQFTDKVLDSIAAVKLPAAVELQQLQHAAKASVVCRKAAAAAAVPRTLTANLEDMTVEELQKTLLDHGLPMPLAPETQSEEPPAAAAAAGDSSKPGGSSSTSSGSRVSQPLLPYLIFDYLLHQRCWRTAEIVARDMLGGRAAGDAAAAGDDGAAAAAAIAASGDGAEPMEVNGHQPTAAAVGSSDPAAQDTAAHRLVQAAPAEQVSSSSALSEADIQDALLRQQIFDAVCAGQLSEALQQVQKQYGAEALQSNPKLGFKLKVQHFVELVRQASSSSNDTQVGNSSSSSMASFDAALAYGRAELGPGSKSPEDEELLSDALSLLAYADPAASPCGHLLRPQQRVTLAEELNGALLKARGTSAQPLLESMYRQTVVLVDELKKQSVPASLVLDVQGMCLRGAATAAASHSRKASAAKQ